MPAVATRAAEPLAVTSRGPRELRAGRAGDLPRLIELWRRDIEAGRQDAMPGETRFSILLGRFDWEARSRVVEEGGQIIGAALVSSRMSPEGAIAGVTIVGAPESTRDLTRWALGLSRAGGARVAQIFTARGSRPLHEFGMHLARPWLRMDRSLDEPMGDPLPVAGYRLIDGAGAPPGAWTEIFNRSFADHWRFTPRAHEEIVGDRPPELCVMALTSPGDEPVAIALAELERYERDARPQPVGLVSSVGTVPEHRRRGLAGWLVAEVDMRLKAAGARTASLYVDGLSQTRAFDVYRKLGFMVTHEAEVWEASFP
ncbi:MAG TPA: GNAT family N-acetyltransferase [Candidatus Dormibacteraeota bacterium]|nr:GNAT family N-acetyltransferase [Candidatus Dormibacteraeota bacterium]